MPELNRVTALGPIEVESKYFRPSGPPIFIGEASSELSCVHCECPACREDLTPNPYRLRRRSERVVDPRILAQEVVLQRQAFARIGRRADGSEIRLDYEAFVGQCPRCERIYIATIDATPPRS